MCHNSVNTYTTCVILESCNTMPRPTADDEPLAVTERKYAED